MSDVVVACLSLHARMHADSNCYTVITPLNYWNKEMCVYCDANNLATSRSTTYPGWYNAYPLILLIIIR